VYVGRVILSLLRLYLTKLWDKPELCFTVNVQIDRDITNYSYSLHMFV